MTSPMTDPDSGPVNRAVTFHPSRNDDELPAVEVAGVLVFAYVDPAGTLRVTVDTEASDPDVWGERLAIPVHVKVNGETAFDAMIGSDDFGDYVSHRIQN